MNGLQIEKTILRLLEELGFQCPKPREIWAEGYLYAAARELADKHLQINSRGGVLRRLVPSDDWGVLDRVYKVDVIVRQYTGELWALQLTTSAQALSQKRCQLTGTQALRLEVGVVKTALVFIDPPHPTWDGLGLTSRSDYITLEGHIYDLFEQVESDPSHLQLNHKLDLSWLK